MRASVKRATEASACALKLGQLQHTAPYQKPMANQSQPVLIVFTVFAREI